MSSPISPSLKRTVSGANLSDAEASPSKRPATDRRSRTVPNSPVMSPRVREAVQSISLLRASSQDAQAEDQGHSPQVGPSNSRLLSLRSRVIDGTSALDTDRLRKLSKIQLPKRTLTEMSHSSPHTSSPHSPQAARAQSFSSPLASSPKPAQHAPTTSLASTPQQQQYFVPQSQSMSMPQYSSLATPPKAQFDPLTGLPLAQNVFVIEAPPSYDSSGPLSEPPAKRRKTPPSSPQDHKSSNSASYSSRFVDPDHPTIFDHIFLDPPPASLPLHPSEGPQALAPSIATIAAHQLRYIGHNEFVGRLGDTLGNLKSQLHRLHGRFYPENDAVVLVEGFKSNKWVAELARDHCGFYASDYYRLGEKDARSFHEYLDAHVNDMDKVRLQFKGKSIILCDDGSYSGKQLIDHVRGLINAIVKYKLDVASIGIVVPFMTEHAESLIRQLKAEMADQHKFPILIGNPYNIPTLADVDRNHPGSNFGYRACQMWDLEEDELPNLGLFVFNHKLPNSMSFPDVVAKGKVCDLNGNHHQSKGRFLTFPFINEQPCPYKQN